MAMDFFVQRPAVTPTIYVYNLPQVTTHKGYVKVGYTDRDAVTRINEQMHTSGLTANILYTESAMCPDGSIFTDKDVHRILRRKGFRQMNEGSDRNEWFNCSVSDVKAAIVELKTGIVTDASRTATFKMRPEQYQAVKRTMEYYAYAAKEDPGRPPKFLWNAKMRFGKTFASYQLAKKMGFKRILVLTFRPAVESAWREDLMTHVDFDGWQFTSNKDATGNHVNIDREYARADKSKPIVVFGSFQDLLGTNESGGIKAKNEFIHTDNWDLVIFDEYHFGAWRENAKKLFENPDDEEAADFDAEKYQLEEAGNAYNETFLPITASHYLFLSGTPFRAINSGEFIEDQIYNWTYSDEQRAKENWVGSNNPYAALPRMVMLTYRIPDSIRQIAMQGEFNEFDLNVFFSAKGKGDEAKFVYENEVQKWLDLIRGSYLPSNIDDMKLGQDKRPPMPYSDTRLLNELNKHYGWSKFIVVVPSIAIREGVYKSFQVTQDHFAEEYGKKIRFFIYNSAQLTEIDRFASDSSINVMIINSQAFNAKGKDARRIYMKLDEFRSRRPIDIIAKTNPILIIDEPQSVEGKQTKERLKEFCPLLTLRYSATHKSDSIYNMVYRLDAMEAYNKRLVKKIAVKGITESGSTATDGFVYLESINLSKADPTATIQFDYIGAKGLRKKTATVGIGYNLYDNSGESGKLDEYKEGFVVKSIDGRDNSVEFLNGIKIFAGDVIGKVSEDQLRRIQIRETILSHLERERQLFHGRQRAWK